MGKLPVTQKTLLRKSSKITDSGLLVVFLLQAWLVAKSNYEIEDFVKVCISLLYFIVLKGRVLALLLDFLNP